MSYGIHRSNLDRVMAERGIKNSDIAHALKTNDSTVSRWRSGVMPQLSTRKAILRAINKCQPETFAPVTAADLDWPEQVAA